MFKVASVCVRTYVYCEEGGGVTEEWIKLVLRTL
jgi:hypothetical protein